MPTYLIPLRQESLAGGTGHGDRRGRGASLHRPPAQGYPTASPVSCVIRTSSCPAMPPLPVCRRIRPSTWRCCWLSYHSFLGTHHLDASERHEGLVAAIAFKSIVKLVALTAVGLFVTFGLSDGFGDIVQSAELAGHLEPLLVSEGAITRGSLSPFFRRWPC